MSEEVFREELSFREVGCRMSEEFLRGNSRGFAFREVRSPLAAEASAKVAEVRGQKRFLGRSLPVFGFCICCSSNFMKSEVGSRRSEDVAGTKYEDSNCKKRKFE